MAHALEVALSDRAHVWRVVGSLDLELARKFAVGRDEGLEGVNGFNVTRESHARGAVDAGDDGGLVRNLGEVFEGFSSREARGQHSALAGHSGRAETPDVGNPDGVRVGDIGCGISRGLKGLTNLQPGVIRA